MVVRQSHSALLSKYLDQYKKKPHSRVFAPLAEAYRKLGMHDEALKILKDGIKRNPGYVLGYIVLAQCYADQFQWDRVYQTLLPLTAHHKDNVTLQKLFAQSCLETGDLEQGLETYKWLLFLNPRDKVFAQHVHSLEDDLQSRQRVIPREAIVKSPGVVPKTQNFDIDEDDWTMVNFATPEADVPKDSEDNWEMSHSSVNPLPPPANASSSNPEEWQVMSRQLDDDFFSDEEVTPEYAEAPEYQEGKPLVSHTLVDLYVAQNHFAPAIDLLEKFLEVNPRDEKSKTRLDELRGIMNTAKQELSHDEQDGKDELLRLVQTQVHTSSPQKLEQLYKSFLQQIHLRADERRYQHV